jgi:hypothetical protein
MGNAVGGGEVGEACGGESRTGSPAARRSDGSGDPRDGEPRRVRSWRRRRRCNGAGCGGRVRAPVDRRAPHGRAWRDRCCMRRGACRPTDSRQGRWIFSWFARESATQLARSAVGAAAGRSFAAARRNLHRPRIFPRPYDRRADFKGALMCASAQPRAGGGRRRVLLRRRTRRAVVDVGQSWTAARRGGRRRSATRCRARRAAAGAGRWRAAARGGLVSRPVGEELPGVARRCRCRSVACCRGQRLGVDVSRRRAAVRRGGARSCRTGDCRPTRPRRCRGRPACRST